MGDFSQSSPVLRHNESRPFPVPIFELWLRKDNNPTALLIEKSTEAKRRPRHLNP